MDKGTIFFDIDRTLVDSVKIRELTRGGMCRELNLDRDKINIIIDKYISSLGHKNDFCREEMIKVISGETGIKYEILKTAHDRPEYYREALYDDVEATLKRLKVGGFVLGIYSEGFEEYQMDKLKLSGIYKRFDPEKIIIEKRKLKEEVIEKMGEAMVVDDNIEVTEYLTGFSKITPIWLNRIDKRRDEKIGTIWNLKELI